MVGVRVGVGVGGGGGFSKNKAYRVSDNIFVFL